MTHLLLDKMPSSCRQQAVIYSTIFESTARRRHSSRVQRRQPPVGGTCGLINRNMKLQENLL